MQYICLIMLVVGLFMFLACEKKKETIGQWMFIAALIGIAIASAPATVRLLHG